MDLEVYTPIAEVLIYDWDALFRDWDVECEYGKQYPSWLMHGDRKDNYLSMYLSRRVFEEKYEWHMYVSTSRRHTWRDFSWMTHMTQEEMLGLANYLHNRDPFEPVPESDTDVLANLVKYGVMGRTVDDGVKKMRFWKK